MSALIMVVTGGTDGAPSWAKANSPSSSGWVSQSWLPSRMTRSGQRPAAAMEASARIPASRRPPMMPIASISRGQAWPTA